MVARKHTRAKNKQLAKDLALQQKIVKMRVEGLTFTQIGFQLNISVSHAHKHYNSAMSRYIEETRETAEQLTQLELIRLDQMTQVVHPLATDPELVSFRAQDQMLKLHDRRVNLLNLKEANVTEQDSDVNAVDLDDIEDTDLKDVFSDLYR